MTEETSKTKKVKETTLIDRVNAVLDHAETEQAALRVLTYVLNQRHERAQTRGGADTQPSTGYSSGRFA